MKNKGLTTLTLLVALLHMSVIALNAQISPAPAGYTCEVSVFAEGFEAGVPADWVVITPNYTGPLRSHGPTIDGWFIQSGMTTTVGTGPTMAFEGTSYAYCEGSGPIQRADTATLTTPLIALPDNPGLALTFHTNLFGPSGTAGTLSVLVLSGGVQTPLITSVPGNSISDAATWEQIYLGLDAYRGQSVQIVFSGIKPPIGGVDVDLAIDQVAICHGTAVLAPVPTLGEWSIISLLLILMIFSVVGIRQSSLQIDSL